MTIIRIINGIVEKGLDLSRDIRSDIAARFEAFTILKAWTFQNRIQIDVNFRLENSYNQDGRLVYKPSGEWVSTNVYMREYVKLPLELIMFVDERGGIENFDWIQQMFTPEVSYYELWFKDGSVLKIDENLNPLDSQK